MVTISLVGAGIGVSVVTGADAVAGVDPGGAVGYGFARDADSASGAGLLFQC